MSRRPSNMGSSKYEYNPELLDEHFKQRRKFYKDVVYPSLIGSPKKLLSDEFIFSLYRQKHGEFHITPEGIRDNIIDYLANEYDGDTA